MTRPPPPSTSSRASSAPSRSSSASNRSPAPRLDWALLGRRPLDCAAPMPTRTLVMLPGMDGSDMLFTPLRAGAPAGVDTIAIGYPSGPQNGYDDLLPLVRARLPVDRP